MALKSEKRNSGTKPCILRLPTENTSSWFHVQNADISVTSSQLRSVA